MEKSVSSPSNAYRYADDLKEALGIAAKWAKKISVNKVSVAPDEISPFSLLLGLLSACRLFTETDVVLKKMGAAPSKVLKFCHQLINSAKAENRFLSGLDASDETARILERAGQYAQSEQSGIARPVISVVHLWASLIESSDPAVKKVLQQFNITQDSFKSAEAAYQKGRYRFVSLFFIREAVEIIVVVLFFLIVIKEGLGELRLIPSESMYPLLKINDRIVIEKVTHWWRPYQRGDVLVFYPPSTLLKNDPLSIFLRLTGFSSFLYKKESNVDVAYIKRLIGVPGDKILVKPYDGVYVNGIRLKEPYVDEAAACCAVAYDYACRAITVPPGRYYFMGDNRNHSLDSRFWGFEPMNRVIGRAVFRIWPLNRISAIPHPPYAR